MMRKVVFIVCFAVLGLMFCGNSSGELLLIKQDGRYGYIDKTGNIVIEPQFNSPSIFSEGLAAVKIDGKYGYINKTGKIVIEARFERALQFSAGLASVYVDDKRGYIDSTGEHVWKPTK